MKYLMFILTYVTLAVLANGCGLSKLDNAITVVRPNISASCYAAGVEGEDYIYNCPANPVCSIKVDTSGHILSSSC